MNIFTIKLRGGIEITKEAETYQDFLVSLARTDLLTKDLAIWLLSYKDLRADTWYSYHANHDGARYTTAYGSIRKVKKEN